METAKKAKEILQEIANDIVERKKLPKVVANYQNLKYDSVDVIEAMIRYAKQFTSKPDESAEGITEKKMYEIAVECGAFKDQISNGEWYYTTEDFELESFIQAIITALNK